MLLDKIYLQKKNHKLFQQLCVDKDIFFQEITQK